jgi:hypothetical protein
MILESPVSPSEQAEAVLGTSGNIMLCNLIRYAWLENLKANESGMWLLDG